MAAKIVFLKRKKKKSDIHEINPYWGGTSMEFISQLNGSTKRLRPAVVRFSSVTHLALSKYTF